MAERHKGKVDLCAQIGTIGWYSIFTEKVQKKTWLSNAIENISVCKGGRTAGRVGIGLSVKCEKDG